MNTPATSTMVGLGVAIAATLLAMPDGRAQTQTPVPPPMSVARAQYFMDHPDAWREFLSQLPQGASGAPQAAVRPASPEFGGTWTAVTTAPVSGLTTPLLLTDGTVIAANGNTPDWYKLTPDNNGNYATGTWSAIASLPVIGGTQYAPLYHASAVLPDGRVIIMGGEYNGANSGVWTNLGAIYDPVADAWTAVTAPTGTAWTEIGDAQSIVLADGTFMLAACCAYPDANALLDAATLTWTATGAPNAGFNYQDEQGYELLPNGNVLTIDIWTNYATSGNATNAEQYEPGSGVWESAGNTPVSLPDPAACGNYEIGPAAMRPDGTLVAFGGNTGCAATTPKTDPTAIYDTGTSTWSAGRNVPKVCGTNGKKPCTLADAPAATMPNGNILFAASSGYGNPPTHFFEFTSRNAIDQVADTLAFSSSSGAYYYNFLVLPNGQVLATDFSDVAEVYTPVGTPKASWAPKITSHPAKVTRGDSYTISGTQFNGLTQGAYYGDDSQTATNYPIVRITNNGTGHVFYARTANHSTMSIAPGAAGSTTFTVSAATETGPSELVVIANGIASKAVKTTVK